MAPGSKQTQTITTPEKVQPTEKRSAPRHNPSNVIVLLPSGVGWINNLSSRGICFKSLSDLPPSETLKFDLIDSSGTHLSNLTAEIVWQSRLEESDNAGSETYQFGARFIELSSLQDAMLRVVFPC